MTADNSISSAKQISSQAHLFLEKYSLAPTPVNYSVSYIHVSRNNTALSRKISQQIKATQFIDDAFMQQLFDQYLSTTNSVTEQVLNPLLSSLSKTLININQQVKNGEKVSTDLAKMDATLSQLPHSQPLQELMSYLVGTVQTAQQQHQQLAHELEKTSGEVNQLRVKLQDTKNEAILDSLTGLLNRRGSEEKLKHLALEDTHSSLMIDIDFFKQFNDQFGHFIGDRVLQRVAKVIRDSLTSDDIAARFGGEEFLVVLVNKAQSEASLIAEKIRQTVNHLKLKQKQSKKTLPPISVSIGVASLEAEQSWDNLFERADQALYQAKSLGRNRCHVL